MEKSNLNLAIRAVPIKFASMFIGLLIFFWLTPFVIKSLGSYQYGLWVLVNVVLSYFSLSEFGISTALERELSVCLGQKKQKNFNIVFSNGVLLFLIVSCMLIVVSFCSFLFLISKDNFLVAYLVLIMGVNLALFYLFHPLTSVLNAYIRFDITHGIKIFQTVIHSLFIFLVLNAGYGVVAFVLAGMVAMLFAKVITLITVLRIFKKLEFNFQYLSKKISKKIISFGSKSLLVQIVNLIRFKIDELVIGKFLAIRLVTNYHIGTSIVEKSNGFISFITMTLNPVFARHVGARNKKKLLDAFFLSWKISLLLAVFSYALVVIFGYSFIKIWIGSNYLNAYLPLVFLATAMFLDKFQSPSNNVFYAYNQHHYFGYMYFVDGLLNLILSLVFVFKYHLGIAGVALGTLIPALITKLLVQPILVSYIMKIKTMKYFTFLFKNLFKALVLYIGAYFIVSQYAINNYFDLAKSLLVILPFTIIHFIVVLSKQDFLMVFNEAFKIFARKR